MFNLFTSSRRDGRPIELYRFVYGDQPGDTFNYSDGDFPTTLPGPPAETYLPLPIQRSVSTNNGTLDKSTLEVELPGNAPIADIFRISPPGRVVTLTIYQGEADDPDAEFIAFWSGRVLSVAWEGSKAKLNCEPISTAFRRAGLRRNFQYMCPHVLYGPQCKASRVAATFPAEVYSITGNQVVLATVFASPDRFVGGMMEWTTNTGQYRARTVLAISGGFGTFVTLNGLPTGMLVGDTVNLVYGCRHTKESCAQVHNNIGNFGGCPWIPSDNPIGGSSPY